MTPADPRTEIAHDVQIGQIYADGRNGDSVLLVYLDRNVYVLRDRQGNHRIGKRRELDKNIGAGRLSLDPDAEAWGDTGLLSRVLARASEYEERGGRKHKHYAEAMREAVEILQDTGAADAHEVVDFESIPGVGGTTAENLRSAGYKTRQDVRRASDSDLLDVGGVGAGNLENIREDVE